MKTIVKSALVAVMTLMATSIFAQEWTKAQLEVWQVVEESWTKWKAGDIEGEIALLHPKFQGWGSEEPIPLSKEAASAMYRSMKDNLKLDYFMLNPARIVVTENAALVDYYFRFSITYTWGEQKKQQEGYGKNAEFYVKEGGKWLCLGDMTIHEEKDEE